MKFSLNNDEENLNTSLPALYEFIESPSTLVVLFVTDTQGIIVRPDKDRPNRIGRFETLINRTFNATWRRLPKGATLQIVQE